jgi:serine/threonine protein phosphatase PrpC
LYIEVLKPDMSLILCSDGLWEMVRDNEIKQAVLNAGNAQATCDQLVELA